MASKSDYGFLLRLDVFSAGGKRSVSDTKWPSLRHFVAHVGIKNCMSIGVLELPHTSSYMNSDVPEFGAGFLNATMRHDFMEHSADHASKRCPLRSVVAATSAYRDIVRDRTAVLFSF